MLHSLKINEGITDNIVLDMSKLVELDPSGIGVLMAAFNDSEDIGKKLYFMSISNEAEKAIAATGFKSLFNISTPVNPVYVSIALSIV